MLQWLLRRRHREPEPQNGRCQDLEDCKEQLHHTELEEERRDLQRLKDELRLLTRQHRRVGDQ